MPSCCEGYVFPSRIAGSEATDCNAGLNNSHLQGHSQGVLGTPRARAGGGARTATPGQTPRVLP